MESLFKVITSDISLYPVDYTILADSSSGNITITLPNDTIPDLNYNPNYPVVTNNPNGAIGFEYCIKKISSSNIVIILPIAPATIEGASSITLISLDDIIYLSFDLLSKDYYITSGSGSGTLPYITSVSDTDTIDLTVSIGNLSADVKYQNSSDISISSNPSGLISTLLPTTVIPNSYGDSTHIPAFTVDANGRLTSASNIAISFPSIISGNLVDVGTDGITIGNGTGAVLGTGTTISQHVADSSHNGYLLLTDWANFNTAYNNRITSLTTIGTSGVATLISNTLNIPQYQAAGTYITSISPGTGISIGGTATVPIVTNSLPDQTVVLNNGTSISITGTYPNFTINNTAPSSGGTVTSIATSGLISGGPITTTGTISSSMSSGFLVGRGSAGTGIFEQITLGTNLSLSGTTLNASGNTGTVTSVSVSGSTGISVSGSPITTSGTITLTNTGVTSILAGTGIAVSNPTGTVTVSTSIPNIGKGVMNNMGVIFGTTGANDPYSNVCVASHSKLYVSNNTAGNVKIYSTTDYSLLATITLANASYLEYINIAGLDEVWVGQSTTGTITRIDTTSNAVNGTITGLGTGPTSFIPVSTTKVFVSCFTSNVVSIVNPTTLAFVSNITVGTGPLSMTNNTNGSSAMNGSILCVNITSNNISVINTSTNTITATLSSGSLNKPWMVIYVTSVDAYFITNSGVTNIVKYVPLTSTTVTTTTIANACAFPQAIAYDSKRNCLLPTLYGAIAGTTLPIAYVELTGGTVLGSLIAIGPKLNAGVVRSISYDSTNDVYYIPTAGGGAVSIIKILN